MSGTHHQPAPPTLGDSLLPLSSQPARGTAAAAPRPGSASGTAPAANGRHPARSGDSGLHEGGYGPPARGGRRFRRVPHAVLKVTMAVSGTVMTLFVLTHMIGNLKVFQGQEHFDGYAATLRTLGYPILPYEGLLWILRVVLLACLVAHTAAGLALWHRARAARGPFRRRGLVRQSFAARTMVLSGAAVGVFIVVHLLDLTIGALVASPGYQPAVHSHGTQVEIHAYANLVASLSRPWMALFYTAVMLVLGTHLAQGLWSVLHDLGGTAPRLRRAWQAGALLAALAITVCNGTLPLLVLTGVIA